jgi:hypothetical protein
MTLARYQDCLNRWLILIMLPLGTAVTLGLLIVARPAAFDLRASPPLIPIALPQHFHL